MKKFLAFIFLLMSMPVMANDFEKAYASGNKVLVYFYSPNCISCDKFNPVYFEIQKTRKDLQCVRINVDNREGEKMFRRYHGFYIPYLVLTSSKSKKTVSIPLNCAYDDMCLERVVKGFKN